MSFFSKVRAKIMGIDPAYSDVPRKQLYLYQRYFEQVLAAVDLDTQTNWAINQPYDKEQFQKDEERMETIIAGEASSHGLFPGVLQVMVHQYFLADVWQRELDRDRWAYRVTRRREIDYFPSAAAVMSLLEYVA